MTYWLYPFRGRNQSNAFEQNFLWAHNNVYIMDNHRSALWCWSRHTDLSRKYRILHIDAHYDSASLNPHTLKSIPEITNLDLHRYLHIRANENLVPTIRWDNYISVFVDKYRNCISHFFTCTQKIGDTTGDIFPIEEIEVFSLPELISGFLLNDANWIVNLDLDFFFARTENNLEVYLSDSYMDSIFKAIKNGLETKNVEVLTISLSPECCGGWDAAERVCERLCKTVGLDFRLPNES